MSKGTNGVQQSGQPSERFIRTLRYILTPLVKLLIDKGMTLPGFVELLKRVFVDVAEANFQLDNQKALTDSRITLITGVHRKDVKRLRNLSDDNLPQPAGTLAAQVIARWQAAPRYRDETGPLPLNRFQGDGSTPSFEELVSSISKDIRPRAALDELINKSVVLVTENDQVTLNQQAFLPMADEEELLGHFGRNVHDHLAAAQYNLSQSDNAHRFLERSVYYHELSEASIDSLSALAREKGMEALLTMNREAFQRHQDDKNRSDCDSGSQKRMTFGVYFFTEDEDTA